MNDFEFQRYITIGQYLPTGSAIHRLDPRTRLVAAGLLMMPITVTPSLAGIGLGLIALFLLTRWRASRSVMRSRASWPPCPSSSSWLPCRFCLGTGAKRSPGSPLGPYASQPRV